MRLQSIILFGLLFLGCSKSKYDSEFNRIKHDGLNRDYLLHIPKSYAVDDAVPLVIALHGGTGTAKNIEEQSNLPDLSDEMGFILCSPNGYKRTWNAGQCCGKAAKNEVDDVGFIEAIIDEISDEYSIDPKRIYATGMSNGAMMSYRLACELSHKIAAIAPVAGGLVLSNCSPQHPVSVVHFHSYQDENVPWDGGIGNGLSDHYNAPLDSVMNAWATILSCTEDTSYSLSGAVDVWQWNGCNDSAEVSLYLTEDGGHSWPMGTAPRNRADAPSTSINANETMWAFFQKHQR